jgi:sucrose-6-phosphate hydrolase SacC (GH32 family)
MKRRNFIKSGGLGLTGIGLTTSVLSTKKTNEPLPTNNLPAEDADLVLNFHLMHPGKLSEPGDPNAAFFLNGTCHLHYIFRHPWKDGISFSFAHVSSRDMLHWEWHKTKLQPSFTGHGMFSGTGFITKEERPAAIYHGWKSERNQIAIAKDSELSAWEKPYPVKVKTKDGKDAQMNHWDPDCFIIGDTYYAISGGQNPPLFKSKDLKNWTFVGDFLKHELPDVVFGEDISCPNFFKISNKWMMLCISHPFGCRYYLGDWDTKDEQFIPQIHERLNWRRDEHEFINKAYRDFFAPESVLTPDGRRVMWAWLATLDEKINGKTIQSLPRELRLAEDGTLRISPLRELEDQRYDEQSFENVEVFMKPKHNGGMASYRIMDLVGDSYEIEATISRKQAKNKRFGFLLFSRGERTGFPVIINPVDKTIRVGTVAVPFFVDDLPSVEDVEIRIFIDKYLIEVFANNRRAVVGACMDYKKYNGLYGYTYGHSTTIKEVKIWKIKPTNQGYFEAGKNRVWEPDIE